MTMRLAGTKRQSYRTGAWLRRCAPLGTAVVVAATGLAALAATAPARAATSPGAAAPDEWRAVYSTHGGTTKEFDGITAPAKNDAWAVGAASDGVTSATPVFAHWNGKTWSIVTIKAAAGLQLEPLEGWTGAYSTSPGNVWFFAPGHEAVVYNGEGWHVQPLPTDFAFPLAVLGPKDVWGETLASYAGETGDSTVLTHWNGSTWSAVTIKGIAPVASSAGGHAWIMTVDALPVHISGVVPSGAPLLYRTSGAALEEVGTPAQATVTMGQSGIAAAPDGRLWVLDQDGIIYTGSGNNWVSSAFPLTARDGLSTLTYDGKNGFWDGMYGHWTGSKWGADLQSKQLATFAPWAGTVRIPGTDSYWAAGDIPRTGKTTPGTDPENAVIAVYGPLP
jgi:hypothetical protein